MNVHALATLHDQVPVSTLKKVFADIANTFERFRQCVVVRSWGWPYWVTHHEFSIDDHIVELKEEFDINSVQQFVTKELSTPLSSKKPLWCVYFFANFKKEDGTMGSGLCLKYNHVMADGYHLMRVLMGGIMERLAKDKPEMLETIRSKPSGDRGSN